MRFFKLFCAPIRILASEHANIIKNYAIQAIRSELLSLNALETYIDDSFAEVVNRILDSNARVVVTGIGKSAIIAQKIVATMNSTGQPSIFMHAADAVHGDLGIIQKGDIVIAISKSGNTPEIKLLAPLLRSFGNILVAMVGNINSELALMADYVLNTTVDKEACPNNLAPTTSTTAQMMMGDALAVALLQVRNFTGQDFSKFHPGGALGKKLYLRCGEIAAKNGKPAVNENTSVKEAIFEITNNRLGAAVVLNEKGNLMGIITDGDIRRMLEKYDNIGALLAKDIMHLNPTTANTSTLAADAAEMMAEKKISQLIITDNEDYAGMVHLHDLSREGIL